MLRRVMFVLTAALFLFVSTRGADATVNITATLAADPGSYSGQCPGKITFKGKITLTKPPIDKAPQLWPVEVKYRFKRSDGATDTNIKTLKFMQPGSMDVSTTWTLGGTALPVFCGWESIEVISPQVVSSNQAPFVLQCTNVPAPNLQITDMFSIPLGNNNCDVGFKVRNAGGKLGPDDPTLCAVNYWIEGWPCNNAQYCVSMKLPVSNTLRNAGGEETYKNYIYPKVLDFSQSPFTISLQLKRQLSFQGLSLPQSQGAGTELGNKFSMTKALTCP